MRAEPHLNPRHILGATYCHLDGYANPMAVALALSRAAAARGTRIRPHTEVIGVETDGGRVTGVTTASGETLWSPIVVNAAGGVGATLGRMVGRGGSGGPRQGPAPGGRAPPAARAKRHLARRTHSICRAWTRHAARVRRGAAEEALSETDALGRIPGPRLRRQHERVRGLR